MNKVDLVSAAAIPPEPVDWLWNGWLAARKVQIIAGQPGTGKTTVAIALGAIVSRGGLRGSCWPDGSFAPVGHVVIWSGEDGVEDTIIPRLIAADADLSKVHILRGTTENGRQRSFDFSKDVPALSHEIARVGRVSLVIVDSIAQAVRGDSNKNSDVRRSLEPLVELADRHNCAILGITHLNKNSTKKAPLDRVNGSIAFSAVARIVMLTCKISADSQPQQPGCVLVRAKSNIGPDEGGYEYSVEKCEFQSEGRCIQTSRAIWRRQIEGAAKDVMAWAEGDCSGEGRSARDEAVAFLRQQLAFAPLPSAEVERRAVEAGISLATLRRARERMGIRFYRQTLGEGGAACSIWSLPQNTTPQPSPYGYRPFPSVEMAMPNPDAIPSIWDLFPGRQSLEHGEQRAQVEHLEHSEHCDDAMSKYKREPFAADYLTDEELENYCFDECVKLYRKSHKADDEEMEDYLDSIIAQVLREACGDSAEVQPRLKRIEAALRVRPWWNQNSD